MEEEVEELPSRSLLRNPLRLKNTAAMTTAINQVELGLTFTGNYGTKHPQASSGKVCCSIIISTLSFSFVASEPVTSRLSKKTVTKTLIPERYQDATRGTRVGRICNHN
eukprot:GHVN01062813.1.p2 GENE.GHVN01062813.1~~GHVN01062813.1.p2  ORF type:complete len:109 (-),score=5.70 GHVN01062813.1:4-330(-)